MSKHSRAAVVLSEQVNMILREHVAEVLNAGEPFEVREHLFRVTILDATLNYFKGGMTTAELLQLLKFICTPFEEIPSAGIQEMMPDESEHVATVLNSGGQLELREYLINRPIELNAEDSADLLQELENVCTPVEAKTRVTAAHAGLKEMMRADNGVRMARSIQQSLSVEGYPITEAVVLAAVQNYLGSVSGESVQDRLARSIRVGAVEEPIDLGSFAVVDRTVVSEVDATVEVTDLKLSPEARAALNLPK